MSVPLVSELQVLIRVALYVHLSKVDYLFLVTMDKMEEDGYRSFGS